MATGEETLVKVQRLLTGAMGLRVMLDGDTFQVRFNESSTSVQLRVQDWGVDSEGEPQSLVLIWSLILRQVRATQELFEWVARNGGSKWFGHIEVHDGDKAGEVSLVMSHTLLGDFLDEKELGTALFGVLSAADEWDDELQARFGGKRWADDD
jgi:hypothetical protein